MVQKTYSQTLKKKIMELLGKGMMNSEIAEELDIHEVTVSRYKSYIRRTEMK